MKFPKIRMVNKIIESRKNDKQKFGVYKLQHFSFILFFTKHGIFYFNFSDGEFVSVFFFGGF